MAELKDRMEHSEYIEWLARARVEPLGDRRSELHNALLMSLMTNLHAKKGKAADAFIVDFWGDNQPSLADKFFALQAALGQTSGNDSRDPGD